VFSRIDVRQKLVGIGPHHQYFIRRPDRNATATTPKDVVTKLVPPEKPLLSGLHPLGIVFVLEPLGLTRPEPVVQTTIEEDQQYKIADKNFNNPVRLKCHATGQSGQEEKLREYGDTTKTHIPWKQVFEDQEGFGRPGK
jgi:hypothetical protein